MKIKTITCHDVYNVGASLQAYALARYLNSLGHETEIIDYKPDYLVHYKLFGIGNPKYDKPFLREAYCLAKLPGKLKARFSKRKKEYDLFTKTYLPLTGKRYASNDELKNDPPEADLYIAGSDQIWNTVFQNGKDPAFYLDFAPENKCRASYAASFAADDVDEAWKDTIRTRLSKLDFISVRENSGVEIVKALLPEKEVVSVLDPVFLLREAEWNEIEKDLALSVPYLLLYDFDGNPEIGSFAKKTAEENGWKIFSVLPSPFADRCFSEEGPLSFLYLVHHAQLVVSNSFHATAFSLIFGKPFTVFDRSEKINARMRDLIEAAGFPDAMNGRIALPGHDTGCVLRDLTEKSKQYLSQVVEKGNEKNTVRH